MYNRRRRLARDQAPPPPPMSAGGAFTQNLDQEEGGASLPDANGCWDIFQKILEGLAAQDAEGETDEHSKLMQAMGQYIAAKHNGGAGGMPRNGLNGPRNADRGMRSGNRGSPSDRRPAHDSAIDPSIASANRGFQQQSLARRFPGIEKVNIGGRY